MSNWTEWDEDEFRRERLCVLPPGETLEPGEIIYRTAIDGTITARRGRPGGPPASAHQPNGLVCSYAEYEKRAVQRGATPVPAAVWDTSSVVFKRHVLDLLRLIPLTPTSPPAPSVPASTYGDSW